MAITQYKVIRANGVDRLSQEITALIGDGFQPFGTIIEFNNGDVGHVLIKGTPEFSGGGASDIVVEGFETAGGTEIAGGTLQEVLQAIADLADPA